MIKFILENRERPAIDIWKNERLNHNQVNVRTI